MPALTYEALEARRTAAGVDAHLRVVAPRTGTYFVTFEVESISGVIVPRFNYHGVITDRVPLDVLTENALFDLEVQLSDVPIPPEGAGAQTVHVLVDGVRENAVEIADE